MRSYKLYTYLVILVSALFVGGCELLEEPQAGNPMEIKLFARMGVHLDVKSSTKGAITSTTDSVLKIGVVRLDTSNPYFVSCQQTPFTATIGQPDASEGNLRTVTEFSTSQFFASNEGKVTYAAWYPWPVPNNNGNLQAGIPTGYSYTTSSTNTTVTFPITGDSDIMYSSVVRGTKSSGFDVMQFKHALSMFRIHVYRSTELDWGNLENISIAGLPDKCTITLPKSENSNEHTIEYSKVNVNGLSLSLSTVGEIIPIGFENKKFIKEWIAAPASISGAGSTNLKQLEISVKAANYPIDTVSIARDFKPGYIYDIVLRFSDKGVIDAQVEIEDWADSGIDINSSVGSAGVFYNLSAYGTANCYIVSAANYGYSFDATVKGNGNIDAMPGSNINTTINPKHVEIIWSDVSPYSNNVNSIDDQASEPLPIFELETNKIVDGKVLFKINGDQSDHTKKSLTGEGNVLLGVYDKEGEGRQLLWTWHIWITDKPVDQNYKNGYIALDRNLGATAAAPGDSKGTMNGLFYQWGRPTPFRTIFVESNLEIGGTKSPTLVTPDLAVSNPTVFYGKESTVTVNSNSVTFYDWVDREQFPYVNNLWGYREEEHEKPIKTIYDPCPYGYHVPYARTWEKLDDDISKTNLSESWPPQGGVRVTIEGTDIWYPYQGFINKECQYQAGHIHLDGTNAGYSTTPIVEMWSALINRHDADDIAGNLTDENEKINDSPYRFMFVNKTNHAQLSDEYTNRSRGLAVRCVSNTTTDVVKDLSAYQTSNCYMVHENGYYKFKATVRGNGVGSLLPLGGNVTAEINAGLSTTINPAKVDILWWQGDFKKGTADFPTDANYQTRTSPPDNMCLSLIDEGVICDDGYVSFKISNFSKGNVVLAAYDGTGNILWTWHIWLTDKPADKLSGNYTKMDRFLGATFAPTIPATPQYITWGEEKIESTLGFYYQWGRKDPIIGPRGFSDVDDEDASINGSEVASSGWWKKEKQNSDVIWKYYTTIKTASAASIPEVVKNPTAFYKSTTASGANDSQWFNPSFADGYTNVALWGYAVADYSIQGQTFSKTMYDPCPPGYRTPFHHSWYYSDSERYAPGENNGGVWPYTWPDDKKYGWESSYEWRGIVTNKEHFEKMWFPFAGYRNPRTGGYENVGEEGHMNTGMPMRQYETRTFWYNANNSGQYAGGYGSAYGMNVRCMKE